MTHTDPARPPAAPVPAAQYVRMSTEHQQYSTANQQDAIREYARRRGFEVVRTYADEGRSGLTAAGRDALRAMIADVQSGAPGYCAILVYDVSRWGRFQDADESAYYEYLCRRSGIDVHYCAEQFENDGGPAATIIKSVKRAMAGEYSRELSAKVFQGQCRLIELGYRQGGAPGYGLRRMLVGHTGEHRGVLGRGERKGLQTDRVVLVPGPAEEVEVVRWVYDRFARHGESEAEIAAALNTRGLVTDLGRPWSRGTVHQLLTNEKYVGNNVYSLAALKADKYLRVTTGKLPEADYAFCDEVFKASSAILNTLLRILNERTFDAGDGTARKVPLKLCLGASNEWPSPDTGKELAALSDRFLLRKAVSPIRSQAGRQKLLWTRDHAPRLTTTVSPAEVEQARRQAHALPWSVDAREALEVVLKELAREGVQPGDRRQFKTVGAVRAFAYLCGADEVRPEHLEVAQHCLWDAPEEQPRKAAQVIARVANPVGMRVTQLLLEVEQVLAAADVRNLADAAKAAAKLAEIDRQLSTLKGNGRVEKARAYLKDQLRQLKLASIEAV